MKYIVLPALAFKQGKNRTLFSFAVEGARLMEFAAISRITRQSDDQINGYQRHEVSSHISNITKYLNSESPMLPNAIVVAFDKVVEFVPAANGKSATEGVEMGVLRIPLVGDGVNARKPAWIVDGQQRASALSKATVETFHVCVVGFIATSEDEQREQFMLVNSTKPLSKSLIYELLPKTQCLLPPFLEKKRFAAFLLTVLNLDKKSPFYKKIKTSTNPDGIIQDNSILKMLENSLSDGVLYTIQEEYREDAEELVNKMRETLYNYWKAVCETFSTAWSLPPKRSRLTHGAGIVALGFVMDAIADRHRQTKTASIQDYKHDLEKIAPICRWTHGYWEFGPGDQRRWNDVQNTPTDIRTLERYLLVHYKRLVWNDVLREAD